jgi:membrane protease YdiL (CAAX protease family)/ribosomal protein L40E
MTTLCRHCGAEIPPDAKFCVACGAKTGAETKLCANCGAKILPEAKFCVACGTALSVPTEKPPSRFKKFLSVLAPLGVLFGMQALVLFPIAIYTEIALDTSLADLPVLYSVTFFLGTALSLPFLFKRYHKARESLDLAPRYTAAPLMPLTILVAVGGNLFIVSCLQLMLNVAETDTPQTSASLAHALFLFVSQCLITPLAEELAFRGLSFNRLLAWFSFKKANLIQALLFALAHINNPLQAAFTFVFALFLGWIYWRTRRITLVVVAHMAYNSTSHLLWEILPLSGFLHRSGLVFLLLFIPSILAVVLGMRALKRAFAVYSE